MGRLRGQGGHREAVEEEVVGETEVQREKMRDIPTAFGKTKGGDNTPWLCKKQCLPDDHELYEFSNYQAQNNIQISC